MNRSRLTLRGRLVGSYWALLLVACAALVAGIVFALQSLPDYRFAQTIPLDQVKAGQLIQPARSGPLPRTGGLFDVRTRGDLLLVTLVIAAGVLIVVALLSLVVARVVARRLLRPIEQIRVAAERASNGELSHRIEHRGPPDELTRLASTFDSMLGKLETSFGAHQRFAASASHELLTPLALTRTALQLLDDDASPTVRAELHQVLLESNERSIALTERLLELARAPVVQHRGPVDLAATVGQVAAELEPQARARAVRMIIDVPELTAAGDEVLLLHLVRNLLDNAVRHNLPREGTVRVTGRLTGGWAELTVHNTGGRIAADDAALLFEAFYRHPYGPAPEPPGHGLGLTIARAIVEAHEGTIEVAPDPGGGLCVTLRLATTTGQPSMSTLT